MLLYIQVKQVHTERHKGMNTTTPAIEMDKKYTLVGEFGKSAKYGFNEREVTIVYFFRRDFYGKGEMWTYVQTVSRIDLRRVNDTEILYGNEFGGMQTANADTVHKYMNMVSK